MHFQHGTAPKTQIFLIQDSNASEAFNRGLDLKLNSLRDIHCSAMRDATVQTQLPARRTLLTCSNARAPAFRHAT
jgi:hypothetical protein